VNHIDLGTIELVSGAGKDDRLCVMYGGRIESNGYGKRGHTWVHREALEQKLGRPIATGLQACHTCDVRACVNPDHLYEGTRRQNMADCSVRGRHNKPHGEAHWCAKVSATAVATIRSAFAAGATQTALGRAYGVHPATVSRIVRRIWRTEVAG